MSDLRIACPDPRMLRPFVRVTRLRLLDPVELLAGWYQAEGAVIPADPPRVPTDEELARIAAPDDDPGAIRLVRVPGRLAQSIVERYDRQPDEWMSMELPGGIPASMAITVSFADEPSTTVHQTTQEKVGMHVDAWSDTTRYVGINLGPGLRYLCIAPDEGVARLSQLLKDVRGDHQRFLRRAAIRGHAVRNLIARDAVCYLVRLDAPDRRHGELQLSGYANMRVDRILHDGSTLGSSRYSRVALIKTAKLPVDVFPSAMSDG